MAARNHIRIMVIDPDAASRKFLTTTLEERSYKPQAFASSEEAVKTAQEHSFQVALIDLGSSPNSEVETVEKLKQTNDRMSCLVITATPKLETAVATMRYGATDYLVKPLKAQDLFVAVERACKKQGMIYTSEGELNTFIGGRIRQERQRQGLTLKQLSDRTDLTTSQLSQVELGKNASSLWALARIANSLNIQLHVLLHGL